MAYFKISCFNLKVFCKFFFVFWIVIKMHLVTGKSRVETTCQTCRDLVKNFNLGMEKTAKNHFGGGDTAWEEENLKSYARSETRLLEILESVCNDVSKESTCHAMVEENEELLESFWFNKHTELSSLETFLCIEKLKACCPIGKYGKNCKECPGGASKPCNNRGTCKGSGTQSGTGECECNTEYTGPECEDCKDNYYKDGLDCKKCHKSCKSCNGSTNQECESCADGYIMDDEKRCIDIDECERKDICKVGEFCFNTEGSFRCHHCDPACKDGCTGTGRLSCTNCSNGWTRVELTKACEDINECDQEAICPIGTYCINNPGSYVCEPCHQACSNGCSTAGPQSCNACAEGYMLSEGNGCVDINECLEKKVKCSSGQICVNRDGPDSCENCHSSCLECSSTGKSDCLICKSGLALINGQCDDINECMDNPCNSKTEVCTNNIGSYKCTCKHGFARSKTSGQCIEKKKGKDIKSEEKLEVTTPSDGKAEL
ncbi:cysteine-rich with EGF-like domain protein 2-B isoform X1 [Hydra vulgaris]|nr:cysteine-rich with EGF-like domain protein 2-B isoform X1 [Hydra vulgaris]